MSKSTFMRFAPSRVSAIIAIAAAVVTVPAALLAWGPDRPTYTVQNPANHVTFNSITNNPHIGDERNFVGIREAGTTNLWSDNMTVQKGKEYTVRVYVHNNAKDSLNASGKGIAKDTTARVNLPTTTGTKIQVDGMVSASNASPQKVWDHANFVGNENFNLAYVKGSLKFENNVFGANGTSLPESIFTNTGAKLGYSKLDGKMPGCFKYAGYVSFKVKPQFAAENNFSVSKQVRKTGTKDWTESVAAKAGETVDYLVAYKNTGETRQNNVHVSDRLPKGMEYVPGSAKLANPTNPQGVKTDDGVTVGDGLNIGDYPAGSNAYLMFSAKVKSAKELECGPQTLKNVARVTADGGYKEDDADVTTEGEVCEEPTVPTTPEEEKPVQEKPVSEKVVEAKELPAELPQTGAADVIAKLAGVIALTSSTAYYFASRRQA